MVCMKNLKIDPEIKEVLVNFYGGVKAVVVRNMKFRIKNKRVYGLYTDSVPVRQNGEYFYEGEVSCLLDRTGVRWEIPHHYSHIA